MITSIKLSDEIIAQAKIASKLSNRSVDHQIEHWAKIGKIAEANPDLTYDFIKKLLIAREESQAGNVTPYEFDII